jgi:thymidylate kinase
MQIWLLKQRFRIYIAAIKHALQSGMLACKLLFVSCVYDRVGKGVILDRSVFSDWVFAEKNRLDNNITEEGYKEYLDMRNMLLAHLPIPQITVYLDVSPMECYRRVHHLRGRVCYLFDLEEREREETSDVAQHERTGARIAIHEIAHPFICISAQL